MTLYDYVPTYIYMCVLFKLVPFQCCMAPYTYLRMHTQHAEDNKYSPSIPPDASYFQDDHPSQSVQRHILEIQGAINNYSSTYT